MISSRMLIVIFAILVLLLAACADDPTPTAVPAAVATEEPAPPEPTEVVVEEGPIQIGGIHPLTGGLAADGIQMDNAIQMAIAEINGEGGVLGGQQLAYLSSDSTGAAEVGQTEAERLIGEGAVSIICCFQSAVTSNVAAIAERDGVPLVIDVAVSDACNTLEFIVFSILIPESIRF